MYFIFMLPQHLHKPLDQIMELTTLEIDGWSVYFDIKNDRMKK